MSTSEMCVVRHRIGVGIESPDSISTGDFVGEIVVYQPVQDPIESDPLDHAFVHAYGVFDLVVGEGVFGRQQRIEHPDSCCGRP